VGVSVLLSVIVVNWNTRDLLLNCLASIRANAGQCEIVVVDNGSTDGSTDAVRESYPDARVILHAENQGYARANMIGLRASTGRYVLFLNSDTIIPPGTLPGLIDLLEKEPAIAACGPKLLRPDGSTQPYAFGSDPRLPYLLARACLRLGFRASLHDWETVAVQPVDWISGACLLVRRSALEQVGGLDERIFMYFEDNDLCLRLRRAGWQVVYNPLVKITHMGGSSPAEKAHRRQLYYESLRYFYSKHYSALECLALRMLLPIYRRCVD
jgi:N-acetylglucosaminyl-diphospho-decaprenol L-rhamnosyltransferase